MRMWTRPSDRASSYGACGQALEKLALAHRLPTLGALAPTSSPLLQQRFMTKAPAPTPTAFQIAPSSQAIRLRNKPANSPGDSTRQTEKQQTAASPGRVVHLPPVGLAQGASSGLVAGSDPEQARRQARRAQPAQREGTRARSESGSAGEGVAHRAHDPGCPGKSCRAAGIEPQRREGLLMAAQGLASQVGVAPACRALGVSPGFDCARRSLAMEDAM